MGTTTFSGPIKAGTIKETTGTTLGSDIKNTGQVVMAQSFTTGTTLAAGASAANVTNVVIPAKSQIIDCVIDVQLQWVTLLVYSALEIRLAVMPQ